MEMKNIFKKTAVFLAASLMLSVWLIPEVFAAETLVADISQGSIAIYKSESGDYVKYYAGGEEKISALESDTVISIMRSGEKYTSNTVSVYGGVKARVRMSDINIIAEAAAAVSLYDSSSLYAEILGECSFTGAQGFAGIQCESSNENTSSLFLSGTGVLTAHGGTDAAGIGGNKNKSGGKISASTVTLYAYGSAGGAGIGGGRSGNSGEITLENCTVYAENDRKSFIGNHLGDEENPAEGGAGIGGGAAGAAQNITVKNSSVTAYGGNKAAGIGSGFWRSNEGIIKITGGSVTAYGGNTAAGIGGGRGNTDSRGSGGTIILENAAVTAYGGRQGAGIGSGFNNRSSDEVSGGDITINGGTVNAFGGSPSSDGKADGGAALGGGYKGHTGNISIIGGARVSATGAYGASAIGCGADGSSYKPVGGKISVENGCEIKAYSDGTKWAIDLSADTDAITHGVLQGRFLRGALKQCENPLEIRNAAENPVLPNAYRCFASNVPAAGIYYVEASDRQKYPVYTASYLKNEGDAAFFIRFAVSSQSLYSFDFLDFRAGLAEDAGTAGGDSQDEPPPPPESEKPAPQTTSEGGTGESVSVETPEEEIPDTNEHNGFILFCFSAWLLFSILFLIKRREPNLQKENSKSLTRGA